MLDSVKTDFPQRYQLAVTPICNFHLDPSVIAESMQLIPQNTVTFVLLARGVGAEADAMSICSQKGKTVVFP